MNATQDDAGGPNRPPDDNDTADFDDFDESAYDTTSERRFLSGKRLIAVGAIALVLAGGAALALSSSGTDSESSSADDDRQIEQDAALEFARCMREQGLENWPDPVFDAETGGFDLDSGDEYSMDMPEVQAATGVCDPIMDAAADELNDDRPPLTPEEEAEMRDAAIAFSQCMRDRGWDFPDPEFSEDGAAGHEMSPDSNLPEPGDPDMEQFEQDQEECDEQTDPT